MKKVINILFLLVLSFGMSYGQAEKTLPSLPLSSIDGKSVDLKEAVQKNKITVISFWAMWCNNCVSQYNSLAAKMNEVNVPFYAVSIDPKDQEAKVTPFIQSKGWRFSFLLDPEKQLFRAMGATFPPHIFIVNAQGKILWEQRLFNENSEAELLQKIKEFSAK